MKHNIIIAIDPDTEKSGVATLDLKHKEVEASAMPGAVLAGRRTQRGARQRLTDLPLCSTMRPSGSSPGMAGGYARTSRTEMLTRRAIFTY